MHVLRSAVLAFVAMPLAAQTPTDSILVLEDVPVQQGNTPPAFRLVDALGRGFSTVRNQTVFAPRTAAAIDPTDASTVFYETSSTSLGGTWSTPIRGLATFGINTWGTLGREASTRVEAGATKVFTLRNGQLWAVPKAGGVNAAIASVPFAIDLTIVDPEAFVLTLPPSGASQILAVHTGTFAVRTLGPLPSSRSIAWSPTLELLVGTDTGDLLRVDPATGTVTNSIATGTGSIRNLAATRFGTAVWTDGARIYSELLGGAVIYTSTWPILDLSIPRTLAASLMPYGQSCAAPGTIEWSFSSQPNLGNANFRVGLRNGTPNTPALLCLGQGFSFSTVFGQALPIGLGSIGLGSCLLHCDPILQSGIALDGTGSASALAAIPNDPALAGATFGLQWFGAQAGANALGFVGSEGAAAQIW
jgi:hypothetical protein